VALFNWVLYFQRIANIDAVAATSTNLLSNFRLLGLDFRKRRLYWFVRMACGFPQAAGLWAKLLNFHL